MKVCIYGAGAVGGFLGARLAQSGCDVSAVARGATARRIAYAWIARAKRRTRSPVLR